MRRILNRNNKNNEYDPKCKYCCNRPWVKRIKELETSIYETDKKITELDDNIYNTNIEYIKVYNENDLNKSKIENTELYRLWDNYNKYIANSKQIDDDISKVISKISDNKKNNNTKLLDSINKDIDNFRTNANRLYNELTEYNDHIV